MNVSVDKGKCIGSGKCVAIAPKTFALDEEGLSTVLDPQGDGESDIVWAARSCPVLAILVADADGRLIFPL